MAKRIGTICVGLYDREFDWELKEMWELVKEIAKSAGVSTKKVIYDALKLYLDLKTKSEGGK